MLMKKVIDLFCGAGGLSAGLQNAGFTIKIGVDIDKQALYTYGKNFQRAVTLQKDISYVTGDELRKLAHIADDDHEFLLVGCPPCQGFSSLGKRNPNDEKNQLVFQYVRLIKELRPNFILMENVPGMTRSVGKDIFSHVVKLLEEEYHIESTILNAADFGVPQTRKRLVLHGVRYSVYEKLKKITGCAYINFLPKATHGKNAGLGKKDWITVGESLSGLPPIVAGGHADENIVYNHTARSLSTINVKRLAIIRENGGSRHGIEAKYELKCHKGKNVSYSDTYGILDPAKPAPTITAGCTVISKGRYGHPTQNRGLSVREAARLQSFSDSFLFTGSMESMSRQVGNAVPPRLAEASGKVIYKYMAMYERYCRKERLAIRLKNNS